VDESTVRSATHNSFATNHRPDRTTTWRPSSPPVAPAGNRKNENNNVLKHYGYHLEHNFGHGEYYIAMILVCSPAGVPGGTPCWTCATPGISGLRTHLRVRQTFFNDIRTHKPTMSLFRNRDLLRSWGCGCHLKKVWRTRKWVRKRYTGCRTVQHGVHQERQQ